ncbi:HAD family hydrolase [Pseudorhodoferax soli]|uniref:HAD superfamily hydrolase (TIGR01509 family) n=1 Tax=Pseudorhodoferax soli TaxID=545864 RepID=A0A368XTI1_9BURK|nr:HAD-IA family hydrolase [Pseudorhodoferax soli]RCW71273.1 HAD superfamily hydrolase (TIGR01509 family) [Pseudorhodoferax soli]
MTPIRALIFDCDGTLVDSEPWLVEAMLAEGALYGLPGSAREVLDAQRGAPMSRQIAVVAARSSQPLPADFEDRVRARMAGYFKAHLQPIEGALELVRSLQLPFCVASNGPRHKIELVLGLTGLLPWFEGRIFSAYDIGAWKPAPDLFLHAAQQIGCAPADCAVVEDSASGITAGLAAGMRVFVLGEQAADLPSDVLRIATLSELPKRLRAPA